MKSKTFIFILALFILTPYFYPSSFYLYGGFDIVESAQDAYQNDFENNQQQALQGLKNVLRDGYEYFQGKGDHQASGASGGTADGWLEKVDLYVFEGIDTFGDTVRYMDADGNIVIAHRQYQGDQVVYEGLKYNYDTDELTLSKGALNNPDNIASTVTSEINQINMNQEVNLTGDYIDPDTLNSPETEQSWWNKAWNKTKEIASKVGYELSRSKAYPYAIREAFRKGKISDMGKDWLYAASNPEKIQGTSDAWLEQYANKIASSGQNVNVVNSMGAAGVYIAGTFFDACTNPTEVLTMIAGTKVLGVVGKSKVVQKIANSKVAQKIANTSTWKALTKPRSLNLKERAGNILNKSKQWIDDMLPEEKVYTKKLKVKDIMDNPNDDFVKAGESWEKVKMHRENIIGGNTPEPIQVEKLPDGSYRVIDGHHRKKAWQQVFGEDKEIKVTVHEPRKKLFQTKSKDGLGTETLQYIEGDRYNNIDISKMTPEEKMGLQKYINSPEERNAVLKLQKDFNSMSASEQMKFLENEAAFNKGKLTKGQLWSDKQGKYVDHWKMEYTEGSLYDPSTGQFTGNYNGGDLNGNVLRIKPQGDNFVQKPRWSLEKKINPNQVDYHAGQGNDYLGNVNWKYGPGAEPMAKHPDNLKYPGKVLNTLKDGGKKVKDVFGVSKIEDREMGWVHRLATE
ncbi:MAG: ParB N-terminal domain-containing protein [Spirochaetes bacterium]|nr:ParB N-terminal domain-containing protein [Spirochaetota bacterium]